MRIERAWNNCRAQVSIPFATYLPRFPSRKEYGIITRDSSDEAATCHSTNGVSQGTIEYFVVAVLAVAGREGKIQAGELLLSASVSCLQRVVRSPAEQEISHARDSRGETVADKEAR